METERLAMDNSSSFNGGTVSPNYENSLEPHPPHNDDDHHHGYYRKLSNIEEPIVKTGVFGASCNLVNAIVGAGIIGIPYAIRQSGFVAGLCLLIVVSYMTDKSLRLIVELARFHPKLCNLGVLTFEDLMSIPFGKAGSRFVLIGMFIMAYGAMVAYLLIIKDTVPKVLGLSGDNFAEKELILVVTSLLIILPLSMLRDISQLAFTSLLSVLADAVLVVIIMINCPVKENLQNHGGFSQVLKEDWIHPNIFIGLGVLSTAMACQHSAFLISGSMQDCNPHRWSMVTATSLFTAASLSIVFGVAGYLGYLEDTQGDILNNFDPESWTINTARALLAFTMFLTYPMESFVARHVLRQLISSNGSSLDQNESKSLMHCGQRELWTVFVYLITLVPALIVDDLGPVLSLTGSLGASCIAYIAPGLAYLGVNGEEFLQWILPAEGSQFKGHGSDIELPTMGNQVIPLNESSYSASRRKPLWWWVFLMPLWITIADQGAMGTKSLLNTFRIQQSMTMLDSELSTSKLRNFVFSIFSILFGVIAAVAGVVSNLYVAFNDNS